MGCVSSKIVARSRSFREDLRRSLKRRTDGLPALDDILSSKNGGDQFLALVCTANTVAKKLQNGNLATESTTEVDPSNKQTNQESINTKVLILMDDMEEKQGQQQQQQQKSVTEGSIIFDGSRQLGIEGQCPIQCDNIKAVQDNGPIVNGGSLVHTRSIDTVEEYDAMVEVGNLPSQVEQDGQDVIIHHLSQSANDQCVGSSGSSFNECLMIKEEDGKEQHTTNDGRPNHAEAVIATVEDVNFTNEKGFRRKAKAKELATLSIPTTVDFPDLGNFGDWIESRNQVFSNGEYVTPKFGKFCIANPAYGGGECKVFDPEMLASFEEAMKQLTEEEECILQQIVENLEEESVGKEENKDDISDQIEG
ncbi:uncharacterized protein LOC131258050 [Magnolia sinica]|uniref:uncharacterized protein LOC131258050 n=1 Tax=Magnolia sinica TaxID=86752 RepID=UPI00265B44F2|nr:uncharacterized protein LOC131258050 [Magnolia sinica]XP_058115081.1 uncharacterized protein LOC131258050 [Magnolia sinica]XP_058115082.1 uncharacterized protein LOC131258050 [Magnolia sinica]XP_058115083.1 uncharacterized protein LOC131258050 [Magnolia sinica]